MINIEALDKVIAVVVVILVLSLFVQSLQSLLKKLFKIKSLQIETSLVHLFHYTLNGDALGVISSKLNNAPFLRMIMPGSKHPSAVNGNDEAPGDEEVKKKYSEVRETVQALYCGVEKEFKKVGRVSASGKMMLDSISKDDLLKFVGRIQDSELIKKLAPHLTAEVAAIRQKLTTIESSLETIKTQYVSVLSTAKVQFDQIEQLIAPLIADLQKSFAAQSVNVDTALADVARLGEIAPESVAAVQIKITQAITQLSPDPNAKPAIEVLQKLDESLKGLAVIPAGIGSVQNLLGRLATWYDTVMQSFEERYTRGMKTWVWVISALVVIFLNANLVKIYKDISTGDAKRAVILQAADRYKTTAKPAGGSSQSTPDNLSPEDWYKEARKVIDENTEAYTSLGFKGPTWMSAAYDYIVNGNHWCTGWEAVKEVIRTLFGWFVMTLLLSAGAPFWEDVLESLFGIKNLVRGRSGTKNVEQRSGEGQPKP